MNKKVLSIVFVVVLVALAICAYMAWGNKKGNNNIGAPGSEFNIMQNPLEAMPETNPFEVKVDPMEGYKNPFSE